MWFSPAPGGNTTLTAFIYILRHKKPLLCPGTLVSTKLNLVDRKAKGKYAKLKGISIQNYVTASVPIKSKIQIALNP